MLCIVSGPAPILYLCSGEVVNSQLLAQHFSIMMLTYMNVCKTISFSAGIYQYALYTIVFA